MPVRLPRLPLKSGAPHDAPHPRVPRVRLPLIGVTVCAASVLVSCTAVNRTVARTQLSRASAVPEHVHGLLDDGRVDSIVAPLTVAPGAQSYTLVRTAGPWRAAVLELDLRCTELSAAKGAATAIGRRTTSDLLAAQPVATRAIAAVNADFFLFAPPGVPTNAHVEHGQLIAGPDTKPVVFVDDAGRVHIDTLRVSGTIDAMRDGTDGSAALAVEAWNRPSPRKVGIVDARWGVPLDTATRRRIWRLEPITHTSDNGPALRGRYVVRTATPRDTLVRGDTLVMHAPSSARMAWRVGDTVRVDVRVHVRGQTENDGNGAILVRQAVAGRPILVRDSALTVDVVTEGNAGFQGPNPRTAIGFNREGTRAWLVVIDGRQPGRSMGMSLTQTGELLRMLGATEALNLDGGGSSALVVRDPDTGAGLVRNTPSDPSERPVGNALIASARCGW